MTTVEHLLAKGWIFKFNKVTKQKKETCVALAIEQIMQMQECDKLHIFMIILQPQIFLLFKALLHINYRSLANGRNNEIYCTLPWLLSKPAMYVVTTQNSFTVTHIPHNKKEFPDITTLREDNSGINTQVKGPRVSFIDCVLPLSLSAFASLT